MVWCEHDFTDHPNGCNADTGCTRRTCLPLPRLPRQRAPACTCEGDVGRPCTCKASR